MKKIFFYFLVLLLAVWLGVVMYADSGYVLLSYKNFSIETSLWFAVIFLIVLFILFYFLLRLGSSVGAITGFVNRWFENHNRKRAHKRIVSGLYDLVEGDWSRAERKLLSSAKHSDMPLVNYLAASFMAHNQHSFKRRNDYLRLAQKVAKDHPIIVGLAHANLHIGSKQWEEAVATLQNLHKLQPKNVFVLQLLSQAYLELKDWYSLEKLLPVLRKRKVLLAKAIDQLEIDVYRGLLLVEAKNKNAASIWKKLPSSLQKVPTLVAVYVESLLANSQNEEAEEILKMILRKNLDPQLLKLYAELSSEDPIKQLVRAEGWLKNNSENAGLLLCLGHLCHKQKLWGKACDYLEKSVKIQPAAATYVELAKIMVEQGDAEIALNFYAQSVNPDIS